MKNIINPINVQNNNHQLLNKDTNFVEPISFKLFGEIAICRNSLRNPRLVAKILYLNVEERIKW